MASYLQAKVSNGRWLLRIEDIDTPREQPGAAKCILHILDDYGFYWDGPVTYQSQRSEFYEYYLNELKLKQAVYACDCTRKKIIQNAQQGTKNLIYPGTCRARKLSFTKDCAIRLYVGEDSTINFTDEIQGDYQQNIATAVGDFNLKRRDALYAYQLAVVVDDAEQKISEVVRGADLLDNTPRQIFLQRTLGFTTPKYLHTPIALNESGDKLSKQTFAKPLKQGECLNQLVAAWRFLQPYPIDTSIAPKDCDEFWKFAIKQWKIQNISI